MCSSYPAVFDTFCKGTRVKDISKNGSYRYEYSVISENKRVQQIALHLIHFEKYICIKDIKNVSYICEHIYE